MNALHTPASAGDLLRRTGDCVPGLTLDTDSVAVGRKLRAALSGHFTGRTITAEDGDFDTARQVWNATVDKRPALIARCESAADVATAVAAASDMGIPLSVRGGGHQVAGLSVCDDGLVIDLSGLRAVTTSLAGETIEAGGGALLGDLDRATQKAGLIVPAGVISHTGLGGLALGGGVGWTCRQFGLTCDNVVGAEVVTASGKIIRAAEDEDEDLLWALRGGGGNFGVVTRFELTARPVRQVLFGQAIFPAADLARAAAHYRDLMAAAPGALTSVLAMRVAPDLPAVPPHLLGSPVAVINAVWSGDLAAGEPVVRSLTEGASPAASRIAPLPYLQVQAMQDDLHPHGLRNYMKSRYISSLDETAVAALAEACAGLPGSHSQIEILRLGGAIGRVPDDATAFANRSAAYILNVVATWTGADETDAHVKWARQTYDSMDCVGSDAGYVNFLDEEPDRARSVYPGATYERLQEIKKRVDPENLFRGNVPIEPAGFD